MAEMSLLELITLAQKDRKAAQEAAKTLVVLYSGNTEDLLPYFDKGDSYYRYYQSQQALTGTLDFRFDPGWGFFLKNGGVSVMRCNAYYPKSWLSYSKGIHNGHMLDLERNVITSRQPGTIAVIIGKMPKSEDIGKLYLGSRKTAEMSDGEVKNIGHEAYIYVEGEGIKPCIRTGIPIEKAVSEPIMICGMEPDIYGKKIQASILLPKGLKEKGLYSIETFLI